MNYLVLERVHFINGKKAFLKDGVNGLIRKKPILHTFHNQLSADVVEKVLQLRKEYKLGSWRKKWYLERYHGINIQNRVCLEY